MNIPESTINAYYTVNDALLAEKTVTPKKCASCYGTGTIEDAHGMVVFFQDCPDCSGLGTRMVS